MITKPFKIIHQYKNNYQRTQYIVYIYLGSLIEDDVMSVLNKIKKYNLSDTLEKLSKKEINLLIKQFGELWYEYIFISSHIIKTFEKINNNKSFISRLSSKIGENWVKNNILKYKLVKKNIIFNHQTLYKQNILNTKDISLSVKKKLDFRTIFNEKIINKKFSVDSSENNDNSFPIGNIGGSEISDIGGSDGDGDSDDFDLESIEDFDLESDNEKNITEDIEETEDSIEKAIELNKINLESEETDKKTSKTADLISQALNEKSWKKERSNKIDFNDSIDKLNFDGELDNIYEKNYILNSMIYEDDNIKTVREKIAYTIPLNPEYSENNHILPSRQYLYAKYFFKNREERIMIGQKWSRRNELLNIDVIPNSLNVYESLRGNLKYLRDHFGSKIKREDEDDFILRDYDNFITNNEIYLIDVYSQLGQNYKVSAEKKRNLYDVFISIYFPYISAIELDSIISMLNKEENNEELFIEQKYKTIRNDLRLESEITELVNDTIKEKRKQLDDLFYENHIIQSIIHVNMYNKSNITGTILDDKFNLYAIFDSFILNEEYPFIQYYSVDGGLIYKFYQKSSVLKYPEIMKKWFENAPYGLSVRQKLNEEKYISFNITETGKIEYRITWKEEDKATINDVKETYDLVRNLLKKINKETEKVKFINPEDDRFTYAFVNSIQKFKIPDKFKINHNELSEFARFFYPYSSLVIDPRKREGKIKKEIETSKFGTYLRYKRVSKFENRIRMHLRILYIMRNFEFSSKELINEVARQFNITLENAAIELDFVRDKYANVIRKSRKVLKKLNTLPKSKPPGIGIDIQGRSPENYKIRITGARNKNQLFEIIDFIKVLIFLYIETYLLKKKKYQKIKDTLKKLTNIAKRRNKVAEIVDYSQDAKSVKVITALDKKRLGFRPDEGQNQWTRSCQNSGEDKKRRPVVVSGEKIQELVKKGFKYDEKLKMYIKNHKDKDLKKEIVMRAINLPTDDGKPVYYYCDPETNKEHKYIGFLSRGNNPDGLCMPCCFKKDQYNSNNKVKENYFKKCIGEVKDYEVEKKSLDNIGDKLYILQETNKIQEGRFLFLSKYLEYFFNKIWDNEIKIRNHYMIESNTGYYLKFTVKDKKHHFLAAISAIYDLSYDDIINKIVNFFDKKENEKYFYFLDDGLIYQRFEELEYFLIFLKEKKYLDFKILGDILTLPGILEDEGLGIYIFNKINDKEKISYNLDCLNTNNKKYLFSSNKNIFLIKENKYYFPIFMVKKTKSDKKIKINKIFNFDNKNGNIVNQVRGLYISSCSEKILERLSISSKFTSKYMITILEKFKPKKQYLDLTGKVRYLETEKFLVPVYHSGIDYLVDFTFDEPNFVSFEKTLKNMKYLEKIEETFKPEKILYDQKQKDDYKIHAIQLYNKLIIPIIYQKINYSKIKKLNLKLEIQPKEQDINKEIKFKNNTIDNIRLEVNKTKYLDEGYNLFRFELSHYLERNSNVRSEIKDIVKSKISIKEKKRLVRNYLIGITNPKLKKYFKNSSVKKHIYFIMSLDKKKDMGSFKIKNQRNYCSINKDKTKCNKEPFCQFVSGKCYFSMEDEIIVEYINRVLEEIIRDSIGFKELLQEDNYFVSDIVNNRDFTNRDNQKILKANNINISKIMLEIFGENALPKIGRKSNNNLQFIEESQPEMEELGNNYSQEIIPNQNSNIRAFINSYYWLKNPLYSKERRNLGYHSIIQNKLVSLLKAQIVDFVLQYDESVPKKLEKYFNSKENIDGKLMEFAKSYFNTTGELEFFILSKLYKIPIIILDKYNEIYSIFDNGKIITKDKFKNYLNNDVFKNKQFIKIKHDITSEVKLPRKIYSVY